MSDYLHQIEERAEDAQRNREMYSKDSRSRRITNEESAKDVPRLLVAMRAVEARIEAATEGPWSVYRTRVGTYVTRPDLLGVAREWSLVWQDADAEFIANARADLPRLLAAIRAVQAAIAGVELDARFRSDWEDGRAALAQEVRVAITDALEGES